MQVMRIVVEVVLGALLGREAMRAITSTMKVGLDLVRGLRREANRDGMMVKMAMTVGVIVGEWTEVFVEALRVGLIVRVTDALVGCWFGFCVHKGYCLVIWRLTAWFQIWIVGHLFCTLEFYRGQAFARSR